VILLAALGGVLLGTIPFAYLVVRWRTGRDLRTEGSGNVGALNTLRVSRSRGLGLLVLLLDAAKGATAAVAAGAFLGGSGPALAAGVGAVAGHAYNPWLSIRRGRLSGGKGFATAAGALLFVAPWLVFVWLATVALVYALLRAARGVRDEAPATVAGMLAIVPAAGWLYGGPVAIAASLLCLLVLPKLVRETRAALRPRKTDGATP
jgi:glycerol-3-phosphate acyltransferase PlsY